MLTSCLTPKHLSGVVKEVSGKTVREWIDELVILEAKALLNSSSMNIQEIADRLNFITSRSLESISKHYTGMSLKNTGKAAKIIEHRSAHGLVFPVSSKDKRRCVCQRCTFDNFRMCFEQEVIAFAGGFKAPGVCFNL